MAVSAGPDLETDLLLTVLGQTAPMTDDALDEYLDSRGYEG